MSWFALRVEPRERRDEVVAALVGSGAAGVQEEGPSLITHFPSEHEARLAAGAVLRVEAGVNCRIAPVADVDWSRRWREGLRAFALGDLTICPPWLAAGSDPARTIVIEPGMAFGTGDHASTRGAVRLMQRAVRTGAIVADLGSGSGVLSIAAARLGAARVYAIELDPDAFANAAENVHRNDVGSIVHLIEGDAAVLLPLLAPVDVVVANILAPVIAALLPVITQALRTDGALIAAGVLETERVGLAGNLRTAGWRVLTDDVEDGWWSGLMMRRAGG